MENNISMERALLCMLLNKPNLLDVMYAQQYFYTNDYIETLDIIAKEYQDHGYCEYKVLVSKKPSMAILFNEMLDDIIDVSSTRFDYYQQALIDEYKVHMVQVYAKKLQENAITITEYLAKMKSLESMQGKILPHVYTFQEVDQLLSKEKRLLKFRRFRAMGEAFNLVENVLYVIAAKPSIGKSALMLNLCDDLAKNDNYQIIYFNYEMTESETIARLVALNRDVRVRSLNNEVWKKEEENQNHYVNGINNFINSKIILERQTDEVNAIKNYIRSVQNETGKHVIFVIDTINYPTTSKFKSEYEKITECTRQFQLMTKSLDATCFVLAHVRRDADDEDIKLSDLKGSGELEQSCATCFLLTEMNYDEFNGVSKLKCDVAKNRDGEKGTFYLRFNKPSQRMEIIDG